jgi:hypothetical protein
MNVIPLYDLIVFTEEIRPRYAAQISPQPLVIQGLSRLRDKILLFIPAFAPL